VYKITNKTFIKYSGFNTSSVSNRFTALENLNESLEINSAWEIITDNIKTSAKENLG
jgi:hypothetical protein